VLSQLIEKLAPAVFKCAVADSFDLWEEEERNTWKKAVQKIPQIARDTFVAWPSQPGQKRQRDEDAKPTGSSPSKLPTGTGAIAKTDTGKRSKKKQRKVSARPSASEDKSSVRACFGCGEIGHAIKDCPKVDAAQNKTMLAAKYKEWRQDKRSTDTMKKLARMQQPDSAVRELYDVMFGNTVHNLSWIADTGADVSVLSETFVATVPSPGKN
jgi:cytochrome c553